MEKAKKIGRIIIGVLMSIVAIGSIFLAAISLLVKGVLKPIMKINGNRKGNNTR